MFDRQTPPHIVTLTLLAAVPALSMTIFLPSLPNMTEWFRTSYQLMQLSVPAYLFVNAVLHVVIGPLSDRYGRRTLVLWTITIFLIATIGCMLAPTVELFLLFRMVQSVIAGGLVLSRAIIRDTHPPTQAASMIGYVTMGMALAPMIGPMIGGTLDGLYGWQASFAMLIVLGVLLLVLIVVDCGETATGAYTSLFGQIQAYPELFRSRRFWAYTLASCFASGTFFAYLGGSPFVGTRFFRLTASEVGFYFGMAAFGYMIGNYISGRYSIRFGLNRMMLSGALTCTLGPLGIVLCYLIGVEHPIGFFGFAILIGLGNGQLMPNAMAGMMSVRPQLAGSASGIGGAIMIGGGALLASLVGVLLTDESGPAPLYLTMLASAVMALLIVILLLRLERLSSAPKLF
ncbi:MAG: multidrug effflux MFS transporter [Rhodobacteraceae bacterium]|nr:multidrug effflux MFS transporter [Paracoccaceae bacterium]